MVYDYTISSIIELTEERGWSGAHYGMKYDAARDVFIESYTIIICEKLKAYRYFEALDTRPLIEQIYKEFGIVGEEEDEEEWDF